MTGWLTRDVKLLLVASGTVFLAELGDKTQLATLSFAANSPGARWVIFAGAGGALVLSALVGVLVGDVLARLIRPRAINVAAGVIFLVCAVWFVAQFFWGGDGAGESSGGAVPDASRRTPWEVFGFTFTAIFLAELGDKTQLATMSLAAGNRHARWMVFAGSSLALLAAAGLACLLGGWLGDWLGGGYLGLAAAAVFAVLGVLFLCGRAEKGRRQFEWLVDEIERITEFDECRGCPIFMRFLEHLREIDSDIVNAKIDELMLPRDQWDAEPCGRECMIEELHARWHEQFEHEDEAPMEKG